MSEAGLSFLRPLEKNRQTGFKLRAFLRSRVFEICFFSSTQVDKDMAAYGSFSEISEPGGPSVEQWSKVLEKGVDRE